MKKLALSLMLAVILTMTLAIPAFAADPPDQLPDKANDVLSLLLSLELGNIDGGPFNWSYVIIWTLRAYGHPDLGTLSEYGHPNNRH